jgi:hypothetical protein
MYLPSGETASFQIGGSVSQIDLPVGALYYFLRVAMPGKFAAKKA